MHVNVVLPKVNFTNLNEKKLLKNPQEFGYQKSTYKNFPNKKLQLPPKKFTPQ